jgi:hypothetical protein
VERVLSRERFGERFRPALFAECRNVGKLCENVQSLKTTLGRIAEQYEQQEELITDRAEGNLLSFSMSFHTAPIIYVGPCDWWRNWHHGWLSSITIPDAKTDFVGW